MNSFGEMVKDVKLFLENFEDELWSYFQNNL